MKNNFRRLRSNLKKKYLNISQRLQKNTRKIFEQLKFISNKEIELNYLTLNLKSLINLKNNIIKINKSTEDKFSRLKNTLIKKLKSIKKRKDNISKRRKNNSINSKKKAQFIGIYYSEYKLTIVEINYSRGRTYFNNIVKITLPTELIGDLMLERPLEVKKIIEDVITVFKLTRSPIILLLGSSYFTASSFDSNQVRSFSENNPQILSRSPYLPLNTSLQFKQVPGDKLSSFHRVIYGNKQIIESWLSCLTMLENPIAVLSSSGLQILGGLDPLVKDEVVIFCDVEDKVITVFLQKKSSQLFSIKLPYGCAIYKSNVKSITDQFFERLLFSVEKILNDYDYPTPDNIYIAGKGLDILINEEYELPSIFKNIPSNVLDKEIFLSDKVAEIKSENRYALDTLAFFSRGFLE